MWTLTEHWALSSLSIERNITNCRSERQPTTIIILFKIMWMRKTERITVDEQSHFISSYHLRAKINVLDMWKTSKYGNGFYRWRNIMLTEFSHCHSIYHLVFHGVQCSPIEHQEKKRHWHGSTHIILKRWQREFLNFYRHRHFFLFIFHLLVPFCFKASALSIS